LHPPVHLGVFNREASAGLAGPPRADELYERSKGHPLFLTELARHGARAELPASLVESVSARCDELGPGGAMRRAAAVIGPELDIELLAALLGRPAVDLLDDAERAAAHQLLAADGGTFRFRHELVREALAASATVGRDAPRRRHSQNALEDVERAAAAGAKALEVGAWACYFDRRFAQAAQFAADGALAAADPATRSRCLAVGGRTRHAARDLAQAELLLGEAFALAEGTDRGTAAAWLGGLRGHQRQHA